LSKEERSLPQCKKCESELPEGAAFCPVCGTAVELTGKVLDLANWGERFVAWLIDVIIIGVAIGVIRGFLWVAWPGYALVPWIPTWVPFVDLLGNVVYFLYWTFMEGAYGQSLGKMLLRLRVATLDGGQPDVGRAALESVGKAFLLPIDVVVGWIFYPAKRQRLFNYLSGTVVVRASR
jgi:uncharacterized RDD family membrane protein YckC